LTNAVRLSQNGLSALVCDERSFLVIDDTSGYSVGDGTRNGDWLCATRSTVLLSRHKLEDKIVVRGRREREVDYFV
jgi:hypothetical protein